MSDFPTQNEILTRYNERKKVDIFGFEITKYIDALDFENAKQFLKDDVTEIEWKPICCDYESTLAVMKEYMPFAWEKANNNRGISAWRSLAHCAAWLWLLGEHDLAEEIEDYTHYGKPQLVKICERFEWDWREWDDNRWTNDECAGGAIADDFLYPQ